MKSSRPANTIPHRARRAERTTMDEDKKAIVLMLDAIRHRQILRMIKEIVHWIAIHQDDLI